MDDQSYFLIVSLRRCGSTFLSFSLNQQDTVFCDKEFVLRDPGYLKENHIPILGGDFSFRSEIDNLVSDEQLRGSKVTIPEYQYKNIEQILGGIQTEKIKVIHIVRNLAHQFISLKMAKKTEVWHVLDNEKETPLWSQGAQGYVTSGNYKKAQQSNICLDPNEVYQFCEMATDVDCAIKQFSSTNPYLQISYEDLKEGMPTIYDFIGFKGEVISSDVNINKIIKVPHEQLVTNWQDVSDIFGTWESKRSFT